LIVLYKAVYITCKHLPEARHEARRLQGEAEKALKLKAPAGGPDCVRDGEGQAETREGLQDLNWMACWCEGGKTRNVHLESAGKMDAESARRKARKMKAEALGMQA
jgi:hypothetical protein